ncbi:MAG: hypothetical protein HW390_1995 [Candidatus Brocadiaceae bacterium]|nr:hypothetical protein [Candidatus Brocadiaceae bacterium]
MVENILVKEILTESMIKAGEELTCILDQMNWPVTASLWFYFVEENQWKMLLTSPSVEKEGPKRAYQRVQEALGKFQQGKPKIGLQDVAVTDESHPLISLMKIAIQTGRGISGIRFSKNVINGQVIEDAYIYRLQ